MIGSKSKNERNHLLIQCGKGLLWLTDYFSENNRNPSVGDKLGYYQDLEINKIWMEIEKLKK